MATYEQVLAGQTQAEESNISRTIQYNAQRQSEDRQASLDKLKAVKHFSGALDGFIQDTVDRNIEDEKERGKLLAIEEDFETQEGGGILNIPIEEQEQYYADKESIKANKIELNEAANQVVEQGGSFQDANKVSNLSGWALYSYVQQKSKIAADGYEDWLKGEMNNNETLKLNVNGVEFTPSTAETLDQKNVAMKALRRQYVRENDLLDVNRSLLADKDVGFYDKVHSAHKNLRKEYETAKDIDDGITNREQAEKDFGINKNFALLLGEIKKTRKPDGSKYDRKEALDETFKVIKNAYLNGDITEQELLEMQEQEVVVNGETYKAGRWRNRWRNLAKEIAEEKKELMDAEQDAFEAQGDKYIMDIQAKEKKLQDEGKKYSEAEIDEMINNWDPRWGKLDPYLTDLKTRSIEDDSDNNIIDTFEQKIRDKQPIYQTDVNRIKDSEKWAKWSKIAKEAGNADLIKAETDLRDSTIKGVITSAFFEKVEKPSGDAWEAANYQATQRYNELYDAMRKDHPTSAKTHEAVMKLLAPEIRAGDFNKWEWDKPENQTTDQTFKKNKKLAEEVIIADPTVITTSVIPGTEDSLKIYMESKGRIVPKMYEDLSVLWNKKNPNNTLSADGFAALQAKAAGEDSENIKSEITKEVEKLPKHIQSLLNMHPDQYRVKRAKIKLLEEDGEISVNDVEFLLEEVYSLLPPTPQLGQSEPRIGDWKDIEGMGYVVWDGDEWVRKGMKGKYRQPYVGNVKNYRDIDNYVKPYDGNYTGEIPLGAWQKIPNATGYAVWDGSQWVRSGNKGQGGKFDGEIESLLDLDNTVKNLK